MSDLDLAALDTRLPTAVSGNVSAQGSQAPYLRDIALDNVSGEMLALPISANGGLTLTSDNIVAADLKVRHGDTRIAANGDPRSSKGIEFSVALDDLGPDGGGGLAERLHPALRSRQRRTILRVRHQLPLPPEEHLTRRGRSAMSLVAWLG